MDDLPSSPSPVPAAAIFETADLHASWARSADFGLRPEDALSDALISPADLRDRIEANARLLTFSRPVIEDLFRQIDCPSSTLLLTDSDGMILGAIGDTDFLDRATRVALCPGAQWSEASRGTNAIGTALITRQTVTIDGSQHYLTRNRFLTCIATPIFSPTGGIAGILDISTDARTNLSHADALLRTTAECIEHRLIESLDDGFLALHFHSCPNLLGSPLEALALFDEDGELQASNRAARTLLHLHGEFPRGNYPASFTTEWRHVVDWAAFGPQTPFPLRTRHGQTCIARAELLQAMPKRTLSRRRAPDPDAEAARSDAATASTQASDNKAPDIDPRFGHARIVLAAWHRDPVGGPLLLSGETGTGKRHLLRQYCADQGIADRLLELDGSTLATSLHDPQELKRTLQRAAAGIVYLADAEQLPRALQNRVLEAAARTHHIVLSTRQPLEPDAATDAPGSIAPTHGKVRSIRLPALRERTDFAHLVSRLVHAACGARAVHMHAQTIARLQRHTWPGNISELRSCLRLMLALLADEDTDLRPQDIPDEILDSSTG